MAAATSRRKQPASFAAASAPIADARRDFVSPGLGALQMIPIAAVAPDAVTPDAVAFNGSPLEAAFTPARRSLAKPQRVRDTAHPVFSFRNRPQLHKSDG